MTAPETRRWNRIVIETPEGVRFSLPLAGPVSRFLAWAIDIAVIIAACGTLAKLLRAFSAVNRDVVAAVTLALYFIVWVGYGIAMEWRWSGQTIGKRVLGLRVMDAAAMRLEFSQVAARNLLRFLDALPGLYLVGGAAMLLSKRSQRLGDLVGNTVVLRQNRPSLPDLARIGTGEKYNSFLEIPHLAARLRQKASPELVYLAYQALLRRDELAPETRNEIFRQLEARFRALLQFPDEITASLTPERYVRNALEVVTTSGTFGQRKRERAS